MAVGEQRAQDKRIGVVVVHGVGESEVGYAVNSLVRAVGKEDKDFDVAPNSEIIRLDDEGAQSYERVDGALPQFRVVRRKARIGKDISITFDGLFWSDLTNLKAGRLNALLGMFRVIFESHHLVKAMLDGYGDVFTRVIRRLLLFAGWLMRGPLAGLTIATSAMCAVLMFGPVTGWLGELSVSAKFQAVQLALFLAGLGLLVIVAWARDVSWFDTVFWLLVVTAVMLGIEWTRGLPEAARTVPYVSETVGYHCFKSTLDEGTEKQREQAKQIREAYRGDQAEIFKAQSDACYVNGPYRIIAYGWRVWGAVVLSSILLLVFLIGYGSLKGDRSDIAPAATSIGIVILQFMLWTLIVVTAIFPMLNRGEAVKDLLDVRLELIANNIDTSRGIISKLMQFPAVDLDWIGRFKFVYGAAASTLVGFVIIAGLILLSRHSISARLSGDLDRARAEMPKLLFNPLLLAWLMLAVIAVVLFIWLRTPENDALFEFVKTVMLGVAAVAALLVPALLLERVSNGVHIARDLIDHHFNPALELGAHFLPKYFASREEFPRRTRIRSRLQSVMENMLRSGPWDAIILVGHSQGSVVIFDYLEERYPYALASTYSRPILFTVGSPIASIYQSYFHEYEVTAEPEELENRLGRWVNLYRVDDYVAGPVPSRPGMNVDNVAIQAGGHMDYWREPEVAAALAEVIRTAAARSRDERRSPLVDMS